MNILPILKNRQELEAQKSGGFFVDELFESYVTSESPIIVYGEDRGSTVVYSSSDGHEEDAKKKESAIRNLELLEIDFEAQDVGGAELVIVEHEYAAEKILDKGFLLKVASELNTDTIVVGIPMKCILVAGSMDSAKHVMLVTQNGYDDSPTYPISKMIYRVRNGEIVDVGENNIS